MKMWPLYALTLSVATLFPCLANAQAPSGVARVDSDTYFDTENASWGYHNHQDNIAPYPDESESSWISQGIHSSNHAGLLGKTYVRGAYLYNGVDDGSGISYDAFEGWDIEFNTPIPWVSSDSLAADFITEFEQRQLTGRLGTASLKSEGEFLAIGVRLFAMPESRIRPYVSLGASFQEFKLEGTGLTSSKEDEEEFVISVGLEADIAENASIRGDFEIDRDDVDESTFEATIALWLNENVFFRGGGVIPLVDGIDPGVTIGGGVAFR